MATKFYLKLLGENVLPKIIIISKFWTDETNMRYRMFVQQLLDSFDA